MKPLIGVTAYEKFDRQTGWRYEATYDANIKAVQAAGGAPVLIPISSDDESLRAIFAHLDGILLPGGGDITPALYGAEVQTGLKENDQRRDTTEIALTEWAVAERMPIFGICRGHQLMNVALGGTLIQDIPAQIKTHLRHDIDDNREPRSTILHRVKISPQSKLHTIFGTDEIAVNSLHHQAVEQVAEGAVVTAVAEDGVIEALEVPEHPFALSVQWHPEDLLGRNDGTLRIFEAFIEAARQHQTLKIR